MFQTIINVFNKIKGVYPENPSQLSGFKNTSYDEFQNAEYFNQVLEKCVSENTDITGLSGTGKTNLMAIITNKLYKDKKTYLMCSNSIKELSIHFNKHLVGEDVFIFCLKENTSHTIDIDYLFSLEPVWDFLCISEIEKEKIKKNNYSTWFNFFNDDSNAQLLKENYFQKLKSLISTGHIDNYGDLNIDSSKKQISAYLTLQEEAYYYNLTEEEKKLYIFFLNLLQLSLSKNEKINILFDEAKVFFDGYRNKYIESLFIDGANNNFIFCSHFLEDLFKDTQIICFKGQIHKDFNRGHLINDIRRLRLEIAELNPGYFYLFDKQMNKFTNQPIKVPYIEENIAIQWNLFMNSKQKKMHNQLELELIINDVPREKKVKI